MRCGGALQQIVRFLATGTQMHAGPPSLGVYSWCRLATYSRAVSSRQRNDLRNFYDREWGKSAILVISAYFGVIRRQIQVLPGHIVDLVGASTGAKNRGEQPHRRVDQMEEVLVTGA